MWNESDFLAIVSDVKNHAVELVNGLYFEGYGYESEFEFWVRYWEPSKFNESVEVTHADVWQELVEDLKREEIGVGDFPPYELVYTDDIQKYFEENTNECEEALCEIHGGLDDFGSISDAVEAAVAAHLWQLSYRDLSGIVLALEDEDYEG